MTQRTFIRPDNPLPQGCVVPWTGTIATIPYGWVLCDGNNGTQNMQNHFIQQSIPNVQSVVGSNTTNLSTTNLPSHTHGGTVKSAGSHNHLVAYDERNGRVPYLTEYGSASHTTAYTDYAGGHNHTWYSTMLGGAWNIDNRPLTFRVHFIEKII